MGIMGENAGGPGCTVVERVMTWDLTGSGSSILLIISLENIQGSKGGACFFEDNPKRNCVDGRIPSTEQSTPRLKLYSLELNPYQVGPK